MNDTVYYFLLTLLTLYAIAVSYSMVRMYQFMRWMVREERRDMFNTPDEVRYWDRKL